MIYQIDITLHCLTSMLDADDAADPLLVSGFTQRFYIKAANPTEAGVKALDIFHDSRAIADLDDFSIDPVVTPLTAHEQLELEPYTGAIVYDPVPHTVESDA